MLKRRARGLGRLHRKGKNKRRALEKAKEDRGEQAQWTYFRYGEGPGSLGDKNVVAQGNAMMPKRVD